MIELGYIDFGFLSSERPTARQALQECIDLANRLEELGFGRYWVGEHHNAGCAFASPELMLPILAGMTSTLKIGVGALLLQYRSPLKIATDFRLIEALFPGRVELGVGRAGADDARSHVALLDGRPSAGHSMLAGPAYADKVKLLAELLDGRLPEGHPLHGVPVQPIIKGTPEFWICGGGGAAPIAAREGAAFCMTLFHDPIANGPALLARYRGEFAPSKRLAAPLDALAIAGVCAPTMEEAEAVRARWVAPYRPTIVGTPEHWKRELGALARSYDCERFLVLDLAQAYADRVRGVELLAATFLAHA